MKVVILAGGLGTRLAEETDKIPKPMVEIGGLPILWHIMKGYEAFGFTEFVVACGYKAHVIKSFFAEYHRHRGDFSVRTQTGLVDQLNLPRENWTVHCIDTGESALTGDRVLAIKDVIGQDDDFMLTYGDGVSDVDVGKILAAHYAHRSTVTITAARPKGRYGALDIDYGSVDIESLPGGPVSTPVNAFREKLAEGWVNAGFMVMNRRVFGSADGEAILPGPGGVLEEAIAALAKKHMVRAYLHRGYWQTMDTLREKHALEAAWQKGDAPWTKHWKKP